MNSPRTESGAARGSMISWLARLNTQVSQWASSMSWWRLILLFLLLIIAGSILAELLHLKHDRVRVRGSDQEMVVTIGGKDGIQIRGKDGGPLMIPPHPPVPPGAGSTDASPPSAAPKSASPDGDEDDDEDKQVVVARKVITARGILGDIGSALLVVFFAYLAAAKIVVRKVAQADAKVRTAVDAAEREAMERQLVQARLQVLQAQVEPHFLFNTLAAVDYLIETEPSRASKMQKALITYLRGALPQMRQETSTLGREMRLIRSYLELIQMRIEERLRVEIAVPQGLESADFPPMMLQSLVENAIKHGIEPKSEGGTVRVAAGVQNAQLWVEVSDTGVGVPDGEILDGPTSGTGIGLQNIRERLAVLYPGKSRLMLRSDPNTGTVVRITVPYNVAPEAARIDDAEFAGKAA
ncbi:sensor histidine kinase [Caenimonas aquaedulcis]|uniref:histidine kinase n=1 Tax=Caenimonas aquaedulcis TaxID=2793270 RepID=A0A931MG47_9BURK|nr:sensor histidine kinase [Caenimonas aquaedulcis]MBG9386975.1 sensor histidine kinase [Caenimonas aquaedulcis]